MSTLVAKETTLAADVSKTVDIDHTTGAIDAHARDLENVREGNLEVHRGVRSGGVNDLLVGK